MMTGFPGCALPLGETRGYRHLSYSGCVARKERREALSNSGAEPQGARKRARRGLGLCAAQSCTSRIDGRADRS
jgi:hypothetical protein